MEVSTGNHLAFIRKNERIIRGGIYLNFKNPARIIQGIPHGSMNLRSAAQTVGILNVATINVRFPQFTILQQLAQVGGAGFLPGMRAQIVDQWVKSLRCAHEGIDAASCRHICLLAKPLRFQKAQNPQSRHHLGAVIQRQTFLRLQLDGLQTRFPHGFRPAGMFSFKFCLAFAQKRQNQV